MSLIGA